VWLCVNASQQNQNVNKYQIGCLGCCRKVHIHNSIGIYPLFHLSCTFVKDYSSYSLLMQKVRVRTEVISIQKRLVSSYLVDVIQQVFPSNKPGDVLVDKELRSLMHKSSSLVLLFDRAS
jgi:hypothetical protein